MRQAAWQLAMDPRWSACVPEEMVGAPARYKIEGRLGAGGMADVLLCTMRAGEGFARTVAVKVVREAFANQPKLCEMFLKEARLASRLNHPNIVSVVDFSHDLRGRPFLVMEYVDGVDLSTVMEGGALPSSTAIFVATEALRGLGHAHEALQEHGRRGVVHRDVSPQNILLSRGGAVKVADFGIAKVLSSSENQSGLKGKSSYMSPEQINGDPLDGRSDLFALGIVLWEMLTGRRLYGGAKPRETYARIVLGEVPPPSRVRPVPADLERVTLKLLAKQPARRYACAEEAIADLLRCADAPRNGPDELAALLARRLAAPASLTPVEEAAETATAEASPLAAARRRAWPQLRPLLAAAIAAALVVAAIALKTSMAPGPGAPGGPPEHRAAPAVELGPVAVPAASPAVSTVPAAASPAPASDRPVQPHPPSAAAKKGTRPSSKPAPAAHRPAPAAGEPVPAGIVNVHLSEGVPATRQ